MKKFMIHSLDKDEEEEINDETLDLPDLWQGRSRVDQQLRSIHEVLKFKKHKML